MFDSPMEHCAVCGQMVTQEQSIAECRCRHACAPDQACPLQGYFTGVDGRLDLPPERPFAA